MKYYICENALLTDMGTNGTDIYFRSKKVSLLTLAVTAVICSRMLFAFFNDSEGPNALIVAGLALALFILSSVVYMFVPFKMEGINRLLVVICIQILSVIGLYFCMK